MSMKRFVHGVKRIAQELTHYARRSPKTILPFFKRNVFVRKIEAPKTNNPFMRMMQMILRNNRPLVRPFSTLHYRHFTHENNRFQQFNRFAFKRHVKNVGVVEKIRDIFASKQRYNPALTDETVPTSLEGYEIGGNIGYGCNAAVYALKLRTENAISRGFSGDPGLALIPKPNDPPLVNHCFKRFPLALKLMYNYALDEAISEDHLWRNMGTELVPLPKSDKMIKGRMGDFRPLHSSHPNVVKVYTAFVDTMPILSDAIERYPEALPSAAIYGYGMLVNEPKTMFVVMKRYRITLRDYILTHETDHWKGRVMLGQLLEGLVFLHDSVVSQRDMKSDNILLEFNNPDDVPHLVISDFGCALATGSWKVHYRDTYVDMGGNLATRAPEIIMAKPGPDVYVDFEMADTWAAGTLAYEIFTMVNPFYSKLKSATYGEEEVPSLPTNLDSVVYKVVRDMLRRDPRVRVKPHVAANAITLSLFRFGKDMQSFLRKCGLINVNPVVLHGAVSNVLRTLSDRTERALDDVLMLLTVETMFSQQLSKRVVSAAELQLRATFLSRLNRADLWSAISYFFCPLASLHGSIETAKPHDSPFIENGYGREVTV